MRVSRFLAALVALTIASASLPSLAEPTAAEKETARTLMKQGRTQREAGNHKGALEAFAAADAIMHVPTTGFEVGKEQLEIGQLVEARDTFLRVSRIPEEKGEPPPFAEARSQAKALAADLEPRIPTLKLVVTGGADFQLTIDGNAVPKAMNGLPQRLNPGTHEIVAVSGSGAATLKRTTSVELKESETKEATLDLTPTAEEAAAKPTAEAPVSTPEQPQPTNTGKSTLTWVGFGVGGAALIAGVVTGALALSKTSSAKDQCDGNRCPPSTHDDLSSARSMATISTISFIVAGVGAGVGVYGLLSSPSAPAPSTNVGPLRNVSPMVGFGNVGVVGHF